MHNWAKEIMECVKTKVNGKGLDNIEGKDIEELKAWVCIAKDIAEYDYYYHVTEAMEEAEEPEEPEEDSERRGYRRMRDSRGRYMRRGYTPIFESIRGYSQGGRGYESSNSMRGYESYDDDGMMSYESGSMRGYRADDEMYRDMDKKTRNAMYYSAGDMSRMMPQSRYESAKRGYEEVKDTESLTKLLNVLEGDIKELKPNMSPQDKATTKQKLTEWVNLLA